MILADEQLQVTFPQEQTVVGFFWQPVGDTEGKVDFLAVQQFIEHIGGFFHGFDGDLGMAFQESPVDLGENGIAPHGGNADPDQGFAGAQGPDHLAQIPVVVLELPGMLQQDPAPTGDLDVVPVPLEQGHPAFLLQFPDGFGNPGLGNMAFFRRPGKTPAFADGDEVFDLGEFHDGLLATNGHMSSAL